VASRCAKPVGGERRVGILWPGASPPASPRLESFREGLREAGFIEGENLVIELRYSRTGLQHLPELAAELVRLKVEVIEASGDFAPRVAQQATSAIPIVASGLWPGRVVTKVSPAGEFWEAEPEHQDYLERYPLGYTCHFPRPGWKLPRRAGAAA
jgi:ABC-type uncharacterized transport system substrate-binding protein